MTMAGLVTAVRSGVKGHKWRGLLGLAKHPARLMPPSHANRLGAAQNGTEDADFR
jgi:hypothetical protein